MDTAAAQLWTVGGMLQARERHLHATDVCAAAGNASEGGVHIQHMQKALHLMNVKLTTVVTDITGSTGVQIIREIVAGNHNPQQLAQHRDPRCKASEEEIANALTGHYRGEHLFTLQQALEGYDFYTNQLHKCDTQLEQQYAAFAPQVDVKQHPPRKRRRRRHHPAYDLQTQLYMLCGVDLTEVDGLDCLLVQDIVAEVGVDMSRWPNSQTLRSMVGAVSQQQIISRKNQQSAHKTNGQPRQHRLATGGTSCGSYPDHARRILSSYPSASRCPRRYHSDGSQDCPIVYAMLKTRTPYQAQTAADYTAKQEARRLNMLKRQAAKLGLQLVPLSPVS